jgi:mannose-P-dolichol utilization defect 1
MKTQLFILLFIGLILCGASVSAFAPSKSSSLQKNLVKTSSGLEAYVNSIKDAFAPAVVATASKSNGIIAQALGGVMAAGAVLLYAPIISNLLKAKSGEGMSIQTWVFNLLGFTAAIIYPIKMRFPISTYVEGIALVIQSTIVLGLLAHYNDQMKEFFVGMSLYLLLTFFVSGPIIPMKYTVVFQLLATILSNYAQVPQIMLSYKLKKSSWSLISAFLSTAGNLIRVFTTMVLTKDRSIFYGHILGASTNAILMAQILMYSKK